MEAGVADDDGGDGDDVTTMLTMVAMLMMSDRGSNIGERRWAENGLASKRRVAMGCGPPRLSTADDGPLPNVASASPPRSGRALQRSETDRTTHRVVMTGSRGSGGFLRAKKQAARGTRKDHARPMGPTDSLNGPPTS